MYLTSLTGQRPRDVPRTDPRGKTEQTVQLSKERPFCPVDGVNLSQGQVPVV